MIKVAATPHKNNRLFQLILEQIKSGKLAAGDRLPPERDLAEQYQCSRVTVRSSLEQLEKQSYIHRRQGSGTFVSSREEPTLNQLKTIAILLNTEKEDISNDPYLTQVLMGLQDTCSQYTLSFNVLKIRHDEKLKDVLRRKNITYRSFDGYLSLKYIFDDEEITLFQEDKIPVASCSPGCGKKTISHVEIDNGSGTYVAANHLLSLGRRHIVLLNGPKDDELSMAKQKGFIKSLQEYGIEFNMGMEREIIPNENAAAYQTVTELLRDRNNNRFDALLVYGDWATYGAIKAILDNGLRVPEDIAVVMFDDFPWVGKVLNLPITAVRQPFYDQAGRALSILLRQMEDPKESINVVEILQPQLMVRKSCGVAL